MHSRKKRPILRGGAGEFQVADQHDIQEFGSRMEQGFHIVWSGISGDGSSNPRFAFCSNVDDVNAALELTIYDEDPNKKMEFMGKVAVPLLNIRNNEKRW